MMETALAHFCQIIRDHTGLIVPEQDLPYLQEKLTRRLRVTRIGEEDRYLALLTDESAASEAEWRTLVLELTTGESYFFRDAGQIRLLREVIFPELLRARAAERALRVWSAGCSTGEEPYSLAMIVQSLLPGAGPWTVSIKGTDINEYALQRAQEGRYGRWAFRGVAEEVVEQHFYRSQGEWQLNPAAREMVTYERLNLIKDPFPDPDRGLSDMDLIVCRNVFIYFSHEAIAGIMARFAASLRPGGYLLTGHAEVQQPVAQLVASGAVPLVARPFPDSVIFQRPPSGDPPLLTQPQRVEAPFSPAFSPVHGRVPISPSAGRGVGVRKAPAGAVLSGQSAEKRLKEARDLFEQGRYGESIRMAEGLLGISSVSGEVSLVLARSHANLGEVAKAEGYCREALRQRPFAAEPHFLLANLVHDRGDLEQTKDLLKKTLYLDHAHVPAYLQLATLYQEEGILDRARQMRLGALDVLHGLPPTSRVEHYEEWTVKELVGQLEKMLGGAAGASVRRG